MLLPVSNLFTHVPVCQQPLSHLQIITSSLPASHPPPAMSKRAVRGSDAGERCEDDEEEEGLWSEGGVGRLLERHGRLTMSAKVCACGEGEEGGRGAKRGRNGARAHVP